MIKTNLFQDTKARKVVESRGVFDLIEYQKDVSLSTPEEAERSYYASQMNIKKRQVVATLQGGGIIIQSGAMQYTAGNIRIDTNIKGATDFMKKFVGSKVTNESTVKPRYSGEGMIVLEPTYKHILFEDLKDWNNSMIIEDGLFLACEDSVSIKVKARTNISSAVAGGEGLFNSALTGEGIVVLESPVAQDELVYIDLEDDELRIDGSYALAWSSSLDFRVERSAKGIMGSAASGEGLVNVYRGTGRVMLAPIH